MRSFDSVVAQAVNENALHSDIATPATDAERVFWDACMVSALSRVTASEAAIQASWALVYRRESERARRWRCHFCRLSGGVLPGSTFDVCPHCNKAQP